MKSKKIISLFTILMAITLFTSCVISVNVGQSYTVTVINDSTNYEIDEWKLMNQDRTEVTGKSDRLRKDDYNKVTADANKTYYVWAKVYNIDNRTSYDFVSSEFYLDWHETIKMSDLQQAK